MRVDVQAALKSPGEQMPFELEGEVALDGEKDGVTLASPIRIKGVVFGAEGLLRARGELETSLSVSCGRCLKAFTLPISAVFDERFAKEGDEDMYPYRETTLDLSDLARDVIWLQVPIAPVCREGCLGICPGCGADRNTTPCGCVKAARQVEEEV